MSLPTISPKDAKRLVEQGALLVDVRGADEHVRERIPGPRNLPLDRLTSISHAAGPILFHCKSGNRTNIHASRLAAAADCDAFIVEGGIDAWKAAGLPVATDKRQPLEIMRQVQIVAGSLVVLGAALGVLVSPAFYTLSAFVGAGLVFAGVTGWCGMARLLAILPWNRQTTLPA